MALRVIHSQNMPFQWIVDPSATFQAGQVAQLGTVGLNIVCGVSDGRFPLGLIDDFKTESYTLPSINEVVVTGIIDAEEDDYGTLVTPYDVKVELEHPLISPSSFISYDVSIELNPTNGVVTFLAGTPLNFSSTSSGVPDSIRTVVSYTYQVPNIPGENSTAGSGRVTIWQNGGIFATSIFDTSARYYLNSPLFVNSEGLITTKRISEDYPCIGMVSAPGGMIDRWLEFKLII